MKRILFILTPLLFLANESTMAEIQVIQVRRNIALSDEDPIFKDYYLSGGTLEGLKVGLVVPVMRLVNLRENNQAQDQSMKLIEPVAWLRIIYTQEKMSVGRLFEMKNPEITPLMEQPGILVGDIVSLDKAFYAKASIKGPSQTSARVGRPEVPGGSLAPAEPQIKVEASAATEAPLFSSLDPNLPKDESKR